MSKIDDEHIVIEECFALLRQGARCSETGRPRLWNRGPNGGSPGDAANEKRDPALWNLFNNVLSCLYVGFDLCFWWSRRQRAQLLSHTAAA